MLGEGLALAFATGACLSGVLSVKRTRWHAAQNERQLVLVLFRVFLLLLRKWKACLLYTSDAADE